METGIKELPTFLDLFLDMHRHFLGLTLHQWLPVMMSMLIIVSLVSFCHLYTRRLERVPGSVQALLELVVEFLDGLVKANMGKVGAAFVPFIGTLFIYIWVMNIIGQVPLFRSPTANYNTTLALTLFVFLLTHYYGLKHNGPLGYLKHLMGQPRWMAPLMFPLHLVQELISRPLSLSMRLFGNLTGEDTILTIFVGFSPFLLGFIPIPVQLPMVALDLLCATLQAAIFAILATVYISSAIGIEEEKH
ncbi:MAG: ATP synthase F0 subunit A [Planctomycetes bacterium RIFCSPHIGHO2_12_FULL_52_36]|nr:MAG: ATP synthase F0 subunit A [Planctomycetes bacterium RIFCSPHIGHO2_02_FULL_52_58]OHB93914.1 MAG: ATP synthase F0 subunit A [Planctomycetes bacterium RIFCSPHIGHO2_12_FULL_52_36]